MKNDMEKEIQKMIKELFKENWHAIEGGNGMCACGVVQGNCGIRLRKAFKQILAKAYQAGCESKKNK